MWVNNATTGPWSIAGGDLMSGNGETVLGVMACRNADAQLICAAPALFAALAKECEQLKKCVAFLHSGTPYAHGPECHCSVCTRYLEVKAALKAAGGREE